MPYVNGQYFPEEQEKPNTVSIDDIPHHDWVENLGKGIVNALALPGDVLSGKVQPNSPQEIERAADLAGLMVGGPAPVAAKMADGTLGSFAGVTSKTLPKDRLYQAQNLETSGVHPDDIWQQTGFFKGADNRWRYEIPNDKATLNTDAWRQRIEMVPGGEMFPVVDVPMNGMKLSEALDHPELFKAYPHLNDINIKPLPISLYGRGTIGQMAEGTMYLKDGLDPEFAKSVLLHELQHSIQAKEGFARGGNSLEFEHPNLAKARKIYEDALAAGGDPNSPSLIKAKEILDDERDKAHTLYTRLMGEVEARNVQARMNYSDLLRHLNTPRSTEEVPRFLQISK